LEDLNAWAISEALGRVSPQLFTDAALAALNQPSNGASLRMRAIGKRVKGCRAVPKLGG
jgi:hypothetical protein